MNRMADSPQIKLRMGGYDSDDEKVQETNLDNLDEDDDDDENANALVSIVNKSLLKNHFLNVELILAMVTY